MRRPALQRMDAASTLTRKRMRAFARGLAREVGRHQMPADWRESQAFPERYDSWKNQITALGVAGKDKRLGGMFSTDRLTDLVAEDIWRGDDLAARAVETVPKQIMRAGWELLVQDSPTRSSDGARGDARARPRWDLAGVPAVPTLVAFPEPPEQEADDSSKEQAEAMEEWAKKLSVVKRVGEALMAKRAYGGSALLLSVRDGVSDLTRPLNLDRVQSLDALEVLRPIELIPYQWYSDPVRPKYGEPEIYWMQRIPVGNTGISPRIPIHESRLVRFQGIVTSPRQLREHWGWGDSILVRMMEVLRDFQTSWSGAAVLLQEFSRLIIKIKGLAASFAVDESELVSQRASAIAESIGIVNAILLDSEEDADRHTTALTGLPEVLDRFCNRLAASAEMPVTLLMGQSPAGLNATGANDVRNFYDAVGAERVIELGPQLRQIYQVGFRSKRGPTKGREPGRWDIQFGPMWQPTDAEEADRRLKVAQADQIYLTQGVVMAAEIAISRFGGDKYSAETTLSRGVRDAYDRKAGAEAEAEAAQLQAAAAAAAPGKMSAAGGTPPKQPGLPIRPMPKFPTPKMPPPPVPVGKDQQPTTAGEQAKMSRTETPAK